MRKFRFLVCFAAMLVMVTGLFVSPAHASGPADGAIQFKGTANLPVFPCTGDCHGTFSGKVSGAFKGNNGGGQPWKIVWQNAIMTASFSYTEPATTCPESGTADGTINISGGTLLVGGYKPGTITGASAVATFAWTRVGNAALVNVKLDLTVSTTTAGSQKVIDDGHLTSLAGFAVQEVPNCASPNPVKAAVAGVAVMQRNL
jgi:hypothetical protein